jgi:hypothetical protein
MTSTRAIGSVDSDAAVQARERECPVLLCVPFTTVNADLVRAEDIVAAPAAEEAQPQRLGLALVVISTAQLKLRGRRSGIRIEPEASRWEVGASTRSGSVADQDC